MRHSIAALLFASVIAAPLTAEADLKEDLVAKDERMWVSWGKADGKVFEEQLTEDAVQIVAGTGVVSGRDAIVKEVSAGGCELKGFEFERIKLRKLSKDIAVLSYTATQDAACGENKLPPKVQSTSIYVRKKKEWRLIHYQETPID
jgi:uncharacterized protein (TIGR02246 family)